LAIPKSRPTNLESLISGMARRDSVRTEANIQSDLHRLLLEAPLELDENDLTDLEVVLEQQAGAGKRIDVEAGFCVFEVKRDLRKGKVRSDALIQLAGYVKARTEEMGQRYVGVLTDGAEWILCHLEGGDLVVVSEHTVDTARPNVDDLIVWLEGVLATGEKITPTPKEIKRRLGAESPGHALERAELTKIYFANNAVPTVELKRQLWARLLTTALGTGFTDSDVLFIEHTLLVVTAEVIAHAAIGLDATAQAVSATKLLSGGLFSEAQVHGVVEADFFDWIVEVPGGDQFVKTLVRRLARFAWHQVEHDVLKVLYESVISAQQRKTLGEYYTPDWLANRVVNEAVIDPLHQRVLDPSCGSGTFLFHAIRCYLKAADKNGVSNADALAGLTQHVIGMDLHPVAVSFARVTYLLAIGTDRLKTEGRPALSIPVYLGDSIQWGAEWTLFSNDTLIVPTIPDPTGKWDLRFPERTLHDVGKFEQLVTEMADLASRPRTPGEPPPSLNAAFRRYQIHVDDQPELIETLNRLCSLHEQERDHIWGYYVRNLARPVWMTKVENRVDVLVGNPPWLAYRFMTTAMQNEFRHLSVSRKLWAGAVLSTSQDLSGLFVLRCVERYLREGGRFGFVMPWAVLRGRQYPGFRRGSYPVPNKEVQGESVLNIAFKEPWDLHKVKPSFFPVPSCVVFGDRANASISMPSTICNWIGKLPSTNLSWEIASLHLTKGEGGKSDIRDSETGLGSPYSKRFSQGAAILPRCLLVVEEKASGPLGAGSGRTKVVSHRSPNEKKPWKQLPSMEGNVEKKFVWDLFLGESILSYRPLTPSKAIIPWDEKQLMEGRDERIADFPGLQDWWDRAEKCWEDNRRNESMSLKGRLDFQRGLTNQFPIPAYRVVYSTSGMYLAAAIVEGDSIIDLSLNWCATESLEEARFLEVILNSDYITKRVRPLQSRGEHNPRHFAKLVWKLPIPHFDPVNDLHLKLVELAQAAESQIAELQLPEKRFETQRRFVREALAKTATGIQIEKAVAKLLG